MAVYYSDNIASAYNATDSGRYRANSHLIGPPHKRMTADLLAGIASSDLIVFGRFKSIDRIYELTGTSTGTPTTGSMNLGLWYAPAVGNDPVTVLDADCFCSAVDLTSAAAAEDWFVESTVSPATDRGKALWEIGGLSADPKGDLLLVGQVVQAIDTADTILVVANFDSIGG